MLNDQGLPLTIRINDVFGTLQDKFGDKVLFLVSDYAAPDPDPFIMVTALDVQKIVFGVWDEPGFGTESEE